MDLLRDRSTALCHRLPGRLHGGLGQDPPQGKQSLQSQQRHQLWGVYSQSGWSVRWPQNWNPERHSPEGKWWPCRCWAIKNSSQLLSDKRIWPFNSIFEAFSTVVQKLMPQLPTLENLLNIFISNFGIEKLFLFDVVSKIYIIQIVALWICKPTSSAVTWWCGHWYFLYLWPQRRWSRNALWQGINSIIKLNNTTVLYLKEWQSYWLLYALLERKALKEKGWLTIIFIASERPSMEFLRWEWKW